MDEFIEMRNVQKWSFGKTARRNKQSVTNYC